MSDENRIISQEEIEAILRSSGQIEEPAEVVKPELDDYLTKSEQDALGEMGNICMGTAATTMYTLLGRQVSITTPQLSMHTWETLAASHVLPFVAVEICYIDGVEGNNLLLLKEYDVALITDLLMGGDGNIDPENIVLDEIHLSAIREVMNQMVGSSSTSLATLLGKTVNISTPVSKRILIREEPVTSLLSGNEPIIKISFRMEIEGLLESEIMQVLPASFAKHLASELLNPQINSSEEEEYTSNASFGSDLDFTGENNVGGGNQADFSTLFEEAQPGADMQQPAPQPAPIPVPQPVSPMQQPVQLPVYEPQPAYPQQPMYAQPAQPMAYAPPS
ncbi:MAG: flagellar motor switch phosphatase FliY, partial [Clostridia bacterium]|nr:flagellar motor switch phosphatase FliY [Clostridia bacterium]